MNDLTLVIPAKNEKESLPNVLNELKTFEVKIIIILEETDIETINAIKILIVKYYFKKTKVTVML